MFYCFYKYLYINELHSNTRYTCVNELNKIFDSIVYTIYNIAMSKDNVMLLMGHKQWRECYDKRTAEDLIKNFKTM